MQASGTSKTHWSWVRRGLLIVGVVALLGGAAYLWGNQLRADSSQTNSPVVAQSLVYTTASRFGSFQGMAAVRVVDAAAAQRGSLRGVAAVRASERTASAVASVQRLNSQGVAGVRASEQTVNAASSLRKTSLRGVAAVRASE